MPRESPEFSQVCVLMAVDTQHLLQWGAVAVLVGLLISPATPGRELLPSG